MAGGTVKVFGLKGEWPVPGEVEFLLERTPGSFSRWKGVVQEDGLVRFPAGQRAPLEGIVATHFKQLTVGVESLEHQQARHEGERIAAADSYFKARPHLDTVANRRLFEAGFDRGAK